MSTSSYTSFAIGTLSEVDGSLPVTVPVVLEFFWLQSPETWICVASSPCVKLTATGKYYCYRHTNMYEDRRGSMTEIPMLETMRRVATSFGYPQLKKEQEQAIVYFANGHDIFMSLATGYGKSLCYVMLPQSSWYHHWSLWWRTKLPLSLWRRMWATKKTVQGLQDEAWGKESMKWCTWVLRLCLPLKWGQCCQLNCIEPASLGSSSVKLTVLRNGIAYHISWPQPLVCARKGTH